MKSDPRFPTLHIVDHPLVQHKLTLMRRKETSTRDFRELLKEIAMLMGYELTRDFPLGSERIETPLAVFDAPVMEGYRDENHRPVEYLVKLPDLESRTFIVVDPMLATGYSAVHAVDVLKKRGVKGDNIRFMALVAAPEGVEVFSEHHPDVSLFVAALDDRLDENAYIVPGLGDAGDRIFGTK